MHQQRSGFVPVALAFSMAQTLGSWQMGQRVGSMLIMKIDSLGMCGISRENGTRRCRMRIYLSIRSYDLRF